MSEPSMSDIILRLDELLREVRRQGRASVGAQAAAEACLAALEERLAQLGSGEAEDLDAHSAGPEAGIGWLRALIPIADAIDRAASQATAILHEPRKRRFELRFLFSPPPVEEPRIRALLQGLVVLKAQLHSALNDLGVAVDRAVGEPIDPDRQRVIEVRAPRPRERSGTVVEVVRPGYALGETLVREAEVVAARAAGGEK